MDGANESLNHFDIIAQRLKNMTANATLFPKPEIYEVPTFVVALLALLYGSISIIAIVGNGLVIVVIAKDRRMQTVTNIFIANLALADVIIAMFTIPFQFYPALYQRWDFANFLCKVAPSVKVLSVSVSVVTLTIISLDRYVAVMHPLKAGISKTYAVVWLVVIWGIGFVSSFPEAYYYSVGLVLNTDLLVFQPYCQANWPSENFGKYYHLYLLLIQYLFPLIAINVSYTRISYRIWGTKPPGITINSDDVENVRQRNKKKVVKMLIIVVLLFAICWLPLQLYSFISEIYPQINEYKYINIVWFCSNWLAMSSSCYNPFIYGLLNEKFKREYRLLFDRCRCIKSLSSRTKSSALGHNCSDEAENNSVKRLTLKFRSSNQSPRSTNHRWCRESGYVPYVQSETIEQSFEMSSLNH